MKLYDFTFRRSDLQPALGTFTVRVHGNDPEDAQDNAVDEAYQWSNSVGSIVRYRRIRRAA